MRPPKSWYPAAVAGLLLVIPLLAISSLAVKSATFDEPSHLVHGLYYLVTGDYGIAVDHPPLGRMIAAWTVDRLGIPFALPVDEIPWSPAFLTHQAQEILYLRNDADRLLFWGRSPGSLMHMALAAVVFVWALRLWGRGGALLSLALCAFSPSLLAHSRLVTTDFPATCFIFLACAALYPLLDRASPAIVLACGIAMGLALLSKHSALICLPILFLILMLRSLLGPPWSFEVFPGSAGISLAGRWNRCLLGAAILVLITACAILVTWSLYGFRYHAWAEDDPARPAKQAVQEIFRNQNRLERGAQERLLRLAERYPILPEPYLLGLRWTLKHMEHRLSFFLGERSAGGNHWYFPVAFAIKTPLGLILLCGLSGLRLARRQVRLSQNAALILCLFPLIYFGNAVVSNLNIGHRHILPLYPFLFILAGGAVPTASAARSLRVLAAAGLAWFVASSAWIYPDYLTYFNEIAGGPSGGMRYLGDSNLDWGQDLKRVRPWMERHGVEHIKLGYFGTALPQYYGISYEWLPSTGFLNDRVGTRTVREGDYLVVSATCLQGFYFDDMHTYDFLNRFDPIDVIGHTLYVYHIVPERLKTVSRSAR